MIVRAASRGPDRRPPAGSSPGTRSPTASAYDPANTHFGLLLACNEDRLAAGAGFPSHPHRDVEVLTWVVSGVLDTPTTPATAGRPGRVWCSG